MIWKCKSWWQVPDIGTNPWEPMSFKMSVFISKKNQLLYNMIQAKIFIFEYVCNKNIDKYLSLVPILENHWASKQKCFLIYIKQCTFLWPLNGFFCVLAFQMVFIYWDLPISLWFDSILHCYDYSDTFAPLASGGPENSAADIAAAGNDNPFPTRQNATLSISRKKPRFILS